LKVNTMIQLICVDVDGTLVGSGGRVHPRVWAAAERARAAGVRLALSSGRPGFGLTRGLAERLDADGWHIFQNGASVLRLPSGPSRSSPIAPGLIRSLIDDARARDVTLELYTDSEYAVERISDRARAHADLLGVPFAPRSLESLTDPIVRAQWLVSPEQAAALDAESHPGLEISTSTSPVMPDTRFMNITAAGVDKASALRTVATAYDVALDQVMFVGDGCNDVEAMRIAGHPVAMANAAPEARAVARTIVGDVDDGAVADAIGLALTK
jgi:Cof subfamily protein (haloacid dehalogenase superfamily)